MKYLGLGLIGIFANFSFAELKAVEEKIDSDCLSKMKSAAAYISIYQSVACTDKKPMTEAEMNAKLVKAAKLGNLKQQVFAKVLENDLKKCTSKVQFSEKCVDENGKEQEKKMTLVLPLPDKGTDYLKFDQQ